MEPGLDELADRLRNASRITVLTGAGVSAASGVPTFRGPDGLWRSHRPETLATPEAFQRDPRLVWEWYEWRRQIVAACQPNAAHQVLACWQAERAAILITQNVDGLHERAGARDVIRFHGTLWELRCARPCPAAPRPWQDLTVPFPELPPRCPECGGPARPAVVWFGERIDPRVFERSLRATDCDVFLSVGTSALVYPAAGLVHSARSRGAFTAEINPAATGAADLVDLAIPMKSEEALPLLDIQMRT
jgi:NAD-dependent deacetylase